MAPSPGTDLAETRPLPSTSTSASAAGRKNLEYSFMLNLPVKVNSGSVFVAHAGLHVGIRLHRHGLVAAAQRGHGCLDFLCEALLGGVFKDQREGHALAALERLLQVHQHHVKTAGLELRGATGRQV